MYNLGCQVGNGLIDFIVSLRRGIQNNSVHIKKTLFLKSIVYFEYNLIIFATFVLLPYTSAQPFPSLPLCIERTALVNAFLDLFIRRFFFFKRPSLIYLTSN